MGTGCRSPVLWRRGSSARTGKRRRREPAQWLWPLLAPVGLGLVIAGSQSWADPAIVSPNGLPVQVHPTFPEPGLPAFSFPQDDDDAAHVFPLQKSARCRLGL